jgi:hypothetical protein
MNFMKKSAWSALLLMPALGLATPAFAQQLADPSEPGSVIVFPKWVAGKQTVDTQTLPQTTIEVGVVCPIGATCNEHQPVKVKFHWVCGGDDKIDNKYVCPSNDFELITSVDGKLVFNPENITIPGDTTEHVNLPPFNSDGSQCTRGFLIAYVVNLADEPIKFDGLIGEAIIRNSPSAASSYRGITIQADTALALSALIQLTPDPFVAGLRRLPFDGGAGHYAAVTGQVYGDAKFDNPVGPSFSKTVLTLLTLDVRQNLPNFPTFVPLDFWGEDELHLSTPGVHFICYGQFQLSTKIDPNLTFQQMGKRVGLFQSGQAFKTPIASIADDAGDVTLLGLTHTFEGPDMSTSVRTYITEPYNNSVPVKTYFLP